MSANIFQGYVFVVDTEQYSGNFERQMVAYMTGHVGDCGTGDTYADMYIEKYGGNHLNDIVDHVADDHGCYRPASIWTTPGWFNNGMGDQYKLEGDLVELDKRAKADRDRAYEDSWRHDPEEMLRMKNHPLDHHPSYNSVAVFLREAPNAEDVAILKERAFEYAQICRPGICHDDRVQRYDVREITVTGFRLLKIEEREICLRG